MKTILQAGLAIGIMTGAVGCSGERPTLETQEQITEIATPNIDVITTTTIGRVATSESGKSNTTIASTVASEITATTVEFSPTYEGCSEGDSYASITIGKIGLGVETICSGDGKFLSPSIAPGSPTYEEFANSTSISLAVIGHRTAHEGPFGQLDKLVSGDTIEFGAKTFSVTSTGMIDDSEALLWLNSEIADSPTQVLGLLTCSDLLGDARGENAGQTGTENRLYVIAVPTESLI